MRTIEEALEATTQAIPREYENAVRFDDPSCRPTSTDVAPYPCDGSQTPSECPNTWTCATTFDVNATGVNSATGGGFVAGITDPVACLQECVSRNAGGFVGCNAVSVPYAGYEGCHLWRLQDGAEGIASANHRAISFAPGCIPDADAAAASCYPCEGATCGSATPTPNPTPAPEPTPGPTPPPVPPASGCDNTWSCGVTITDGDPGVTNAAGGGYLEGVMDPIACLQACVQQNQGGTVGCNAVSLPTTWYQACHLWLLDLDVVQTVPNADFRSIIFEPGCIPDADAAAATCYQCDGAACGGTATPPGPGSAPPPDSTPAPPPDSAPTPPPGSTTGGPVSVAPESVSYGQIEVGASDSKAVTLDNPNGAEVDLTRIDCSAGSAAPYLSIQLPDGRSISCGNSVTLSPPYAIPSGAVNVSCVFEPTAIVELQATLTFSGASGAFGAVAVSGTGGDPFSLQHTLHPVIEVQPVYMLPPGVTSKYVYIQGQESHTHGPGDVLVQWQWTNVATGDVEVTSDTANYGKQLDLGTYTYQLKVTDQKGNSDTAEATFSVASEDAVDGTYVRVYESNSLSSLPPLPVFADVTSSVFSVSAGGYKDPGGSFVLRMVGTIIPPEDFEPSFAVVPGSGGSVQSSLVLLNDAPPGNGIFPGGQEYVLDVRVLLSGPASLRFELNGLPISYSVVNVAGEPPIINALATGTNAAADGAGTLEGFLVREPATVTVGGTPASIVQQSENSIQFTYPSGLAAGPNDLVVTRDGLSSNSITVYIKDFGSKGPQGGPFSPNPKFNQKVAQSGGADHATPSIDRVVWCNGHLFAAAAYQGGGKIWRYDCNEDWDCNLVDEAEVAPWPYNSILGLACDPWESDANTKLWFGHNHLYAAGGAQPTGYAEYKGRVSYVEWFKPGKPVTLVVSNLAVSNHDHAVNDLGFLHDGDLLITTASNTNAGITSPPMGYLPENPTSTGIWRVKVRASNFNGVLQYQWLPNAPANYVNQAAPSDQRYGEWAQLVPNPNFSLFAAGARNPFGLEVRSKGQILMTDNGPNNGYGKQMTDVSAGCVKPASARGTDECQEQTGSDPAASDSVRLSIQEGDYFGTPNAARCREWLVTGTGNPDECEFTNPNNIPAKPPSCAATRTGPDGCTLSKPDKILESSLGGPFEYISYAFGGTWFGQIFIPSLQSSRWRYDASSGVAVQDWADPGYPYSPGVDAQQGPGGAHIYASYQAQQVKINVPEDAIAEEALGGHGNPSVYDIAPMKSAVGVAGKEFIIGGINFNNMADVTVSFGGLQVTPTSVGSKWIKGQLPAGNADVDCNVDVIVNYTDTRAGQGAGSLTLPGIFCWLPARSSACSSCQG